MGSDFVPLNNEFVHPKLYILLYEQGVLNKFEQSLIRFVYIVVPSLPLCVLALLKFYTSYMTSMMIRRDLYVYNSMHTLH